MNSIDVRGNAIRLTDDEIAPFLESSAGFVAVEVSTKWCVPCQFLRPILRKLGHEFADNMTLVEIDGDAAPTFRRTHEIKFFPQVLVFKQGKLVGRQGGSATPEKVRTTMMGFLGLQADGEPSAAELTFRDHQSKALAAFSDMTTPTIKACGPFYDAVEAMEESLKAEVTAGRLSEGDAKARMEAEYPRLEEPFKDKIAASDKAMEEGLRSYSATMAEAVAEFVQAGKPAPSADPAELAGLICEPGDRFCSVKQDPARTS